MKGSWHVILHIAIIVLLAINIVLLVKETDPEIHIHVNNVEEQEEGG